MSDVSTSSFCLEVPDIVIAGARRGDMRALEHLYRLFERPAWTLAQRLCGNAEDAREVVHDAMLRLFERVGQFRGDSPFWGWVRQIVLNEALMRLRRERGREAEALDDTDEPAHEHVTPWQWAEARGLEAALATLPALTRSVIWLYHVEGYTHPEIAGLTGKSVSFSKSQLARGTARLREVLGAEEVPACPAPIPLTA